jgi:hypothetical protein
MGTSVFTFVLSLIDIGQTLAKIRWTCGLYVMCRTTGKPLLQVKWGPEKDRLYMEEGVGFGVDGPHSGALTVRRGDRVRRRVGAMVPGGVS